MKKLILVLAIALMAVPAMALDVYMTAVDSDTLAVMYKNADTANLPRAFALQITLDGTGVFNAINGFKTGESTSASKGFGIFPARIAIDSAGVVTNYGNPLADTADPGAAGTGLGTATVVLEFGSLYFGDTNAPATSGQLCTLDFTKGTATKATLTTESTYRGGIVLEDGTPVTDTNELTLAAPECYKTTGPDYAVWVQFGKPACWCYQRQCRGDFDGLKVGVQWVQANDLNALVAAYAKNLTWLTQNPQYICADFDHAKVGVQRVQANDLNTLVLYYAKNATVVQVCPMTNINFWTN